MEEGERFPYTVSYEETTGRWLIRHNTGRVVYRFTSESDAHIELERFRIWWEDSTSARELAEPVDLILLVERVLQKLKLWHLRTEANRRKS